MTNFTVVYDACVLYPAAARDLVVEIARTGLLRAKWTARIHAEWINAAIRARPDLNRSRLERAAELMNKAVPDCLVAGFESLEAGLTSLPDADDRHVLAAAIHCGAQEIVTFNLRDFPDAATMSRYARRANPSTTCLATYSHACLRIGGFEKQNRTYRSQLRPLFMPPI